MNDEWRAFVERRTGVPLDDLALRAISPDEAIQALWPLNDVFRPKIHQIRSLPYRERFEREADEAIIAFADDPRASTWAGLTWGAWRVLLERQTQILLTFTANAAAGRKEICFIPALLTKEDWLPALILEWLLRMKLPWPPTDRSDFEWPEAPGDLRLTLQ